MSCNTRPRESWDKLNAAGEKLLAKFLRDEAAKFQRILAVEQPFEIGLSNAPAPFVGIIDLIAAISSKITLVDFKTAGSDYDECDVRLSDQLTTYYLARPEIEQAAICVLVKKSCRKSVWHFTERTPERQVEYLRKTEMMVRDITDQVFYRRA